MAWSTIFSVSSWGSYLEKPTLSPGSGSVTQKLGRDKHESSSVDGREKEGQ